MASLREPVAELEPDSALEHALQDISGAAERMSVEHAGMTQELLSVYEQLGAVFEVTRRLSRVEGESDILDLFVDSLRMSFNAYHVLAVYPEALVGPPSDGSGHGVGPWLGDLIRKARDEATVQVDRPPAGEFPGIDEVLVGSVMAGDAFICAIVFTRTIDADRFRASDMLVLGSLTMFCGDLIRNHRLVGELREMSISVVRALVNAVDQKDEYTSGHSLRVAYYARLLGEIVGLSDPELQMLEWSALLHDVGKIGIRDDVLKKEGKLTDAEFEHIKEHPVRSHRIVQAVPQLAQALDGVLHHHEHYNGRGYPSGLCGENIPLQARILQVADVFDALTSTRSYRPAFDWREALAILDREASKTVDPKLQKMFDRHIRKMVDPDGWQRVVDRANGFVQGTRSVPTDFRSR